MRSTISGRRGTAWLLAGLLVLFTPAVALAQSGGAFIVLYEVLESPPPRPSTGEVGAFVPNPLAGTLTRLAQATLSGTGVQAAGSIANWAGAAIEAHAQSRVDLLGTGQGPISGVFNVDLAGGAVSGKLNGTLDLSMLLAGKAPLAPVTAGQWNTLGNTRLAGGFGGVAQVPVPCSALGSPANNFCYLTPDGSGVEELQAHEFNRDGIPLVRFMLQLVAL